MRILPIAVILLGCGTSLLGQSASAPSAGAGWARVQALSAGTSLHVQAKSKLDCRLQSVDADSLACRKGSRTVIFPRSEIMKIEVIKRGVSTAVAAGIGVGVGFGIDAALSKSLLDGGKIKGNVAVASGAAGGILLAPLGYFGGWIRETVYIAPVYSVP